MKLKKYMVENMSQAMDKIRDDFGDDAYIFDTKKIKKGGFLGLGGRKMIEVTVVSENENGENYTENNKDKFVPNNSSDIYNLQQMVNQNKRLNERINKLKNTETPQENDNSKQDIFKLIEEQRKISIKMDDDAKKFYGDEIKSEVKEENKNNFFTENKNSEIEELKKMIKNINNKVSGKNEVIFSIREKLLNNDFSHNIINEFLDESENLNITEDWESNEQLENKFSEILDKSLNLSGQQLKGKVILVGPTGVGKTTTIAKLTAIIKKQNRKIAIVTIDTYRIAASDQLKIYADIMGVPAYVCYTPDDLKITLETLVDYDTILIDTAGRSHKNDIQLDELKVFIDNIEPDFKILVMSATTRIKDMFDIYDNFSLINPQGLILTKLDETSSYGQIFSVSEYTGLPINFITDGQKVPDDISAPDKNVILARAVREVFK